MKKTLFTAIVDAVWSLEDRLRATVLRRRYGGGVYVEPPAYFPKRLRRKYGLGEYWKDCSAETEL